MPAETNFKIFNEANDASTTYNDSEYQNATQRLTGVTPGMALSRMHNKMFRQWSVMCKAIADMMVAKGYSAMDDNEQQIAEDLQAIIDAAASDLGYLLRKNSTQYAVGDIAFSASLPSSLVLQCTAAGTTASTAPDFSGAAEGDTVTDGTVVWTYKSILSGGGVPVGFIMPYAGTGLAEGYLDCDGSAVSRTMYPDLFAAIGTTWGAGDGSTTFNLPRSEDLVLQGASATNPVGTYKTAGLPNIEGFAYLSDVATTFTLSEMSGAFSGYYEDGNGRPNRQSTYADSSRALDFDASKSNPIYGASDTVQSPAACVRFMIKAFDGPTPSSAGIDLTQYAQDLANRLTREQTPAFNHRDVVTTSGTYTAPVTGWYRITVKGGGGGGAGSYRSSGSLMSGGGGGEGGTTIGYEKMTAGDTASVVIGAGGTGGAAGNYAGADGGNSSVAVNNNTYTGGGGGGGGADTTIVHYGAGTGGTGTIPGAPGGSGQHNGTSTYVQGGVGGGNGGGNTRYESAGSAGINGGGGAGGTAGASSFAGGNGGDGYVWFEYFAAA